MLRISELSWPRILYTRSAAILLGIAALFTLTALFIRYSDFDSNKLGRIQFEFISYLGAFSALGFFSLLISMTFFWLRCDVSSKRSRAIWFFLLLIGFSYGSQIVYYAFVYLPAVIRRLRNPSNAAFAAPFPQIENRRNVIGTFGWVLIIGWGLLALFVAAGFTFPKIVFQFTSHLLGPDNTYIALWLWVVSLTISTPVYLITLLFRVGMKRRASSSPPSSPDLKSHS